MALGIYWATALLCFFVALLALDIMGFFSLKNHFNVDGRTVVITGGSQGMGRALGKLLAKKGASVVIVARTESKLVQALDVISRAAKDPSTQRFHYISADLTNAGENTRVISEVTAWNHGQPPDIVWANAGYSHPSLFVDAPLEVLREQMDTNYWTAAYLAHATLRSWLKPSPSKSGTASSKAVPPRHFLMTSSTVCFVGVAGYAPYAPTKAALRSLADTLRSEVNLYNGHRHSKPGAGAPADIKIHCVCPGTITSPGLDNEEKTKHEVTKILESGDPRQTEDEVAAAAVKGLEKGGYLVTTQLLGYAMKSGALGGSPRDNKFLDTVFSWLVSVAWLFVGPDMEGKVFDYGKTHSGILPKS